MKKILLLIFVTTIVTIQLNAQNKSNNLDTLNKTINLEEVVISATNFKENKKNIAQKVDVISEKTIANTNAQNTGDLLLSTGKIFVQKSQQGGSSPVIRGFEASRVLLIIDGVRMNNAIYRSGHLQNVITTDQNMLSRVEILYGPSSAVYGSDALGGAIHFITKSPTLSTTKDVFTTGSSLLRYSDANKEKTIHIDASFASKKFGWLQSYNFSNFGDMRMGNNYPELYPDFGRRKNYMTQINGVDSVVQNSDDAVQKFSGYKQWDILQKFLFKPNEKFTHVVNLQLSNSTNVPRYDRLQDVRNGTLRFAEWYYGPQKRLMGSYEFTGLNIANINEVKLNVNYQNIEESRITRDYRRNDRFDSRVEKVKVFGATLSGRKLFTNDEITAGIDVQLNDVNSSATRLNQNTGVVTKLDTRYNNGKNNMNSFAIFVQHVHKFTNKKLILNDGIRIQAISLKSNIADNSFFKLPDTAVHQKNSAITFNAGLIYNPTQKTTVRFNISSGFRVPNVDDLAKLFESSTAAKQVVVPNANIKPEYTYNVDFGIAHQFGKVLTVEFTGYYTLFRNAITKAPFLLNGQDSIQYNGVKSQVLANQNVNKANVLGFTAGFTANISKTVSLNSTLSYTKGYFIADANKPSRVYDRLPNGTYGIVLKNVSTRPLDHIPPVIGRTAITVNTKKLNAELFFIYNGWKRIANFNTDGEDNAQYATADGMPSWVTCNVKASYNIIKSIQVQVGVENMFDRNYRYFASGFSAPGRNVYVTVRTNW